MKHKAWFAGIAVMALALLVGGVAWAAETAQSPSRVQGPIVRGTVIAVHGDQVSIETAGGDEVLLLITDSTLLWVPGEPPTTTVQLAAGDPVLAFGQPAKAETDSQALPTRLVMVASEEDLPKVLIRGRALAITRQTIIVQTGRRERAVTVLPRTRLWSARGRLDSLRNVRAGDQIIALGQPTELGQWIAGVVILVGREPPTQPRLRGKVIAVDAVAATLTVETEKRGEITVVTTDETRFRLVAGRQGENQAPGAEAPGFDDIDVGDVVVAVGRFDEEHPDTFLARGIGVIVDPGQGKRTPQENASPPDA